MSANKFIIRLLEVAISATVLLTIGACGSKKQAMAESPITLPKAQKTTISSKVEEQNFIKRVFDNRVHAENIVGNMTFELKTDGKEIAVPGALRMRKNKVIRIQLFIPLLGTEVGRLEFTPDYVLVLDRIHKEYIKADYNQLDFLQKNGLNFYSLQALFWNELVMPGTKGVQLDDLNNYDVDLKSSEQYVSLKLSNGKMQYRWQTERKDARIIQAAVSYSASGMPTSTMQWNYADFKATGGSFFPASQMFNFTTVLGGKVRNASVSLEMNSVRNDDKWDAMTTVSDRYRRIDARGLFDKILNM